MGTSGYFLQRADAYRQAAALTKSEELAGDLYEIAAVFRRMASDLEKYAQAKKPTGLWGAHFMWSALKRRICQFDYPSNGQVIGYGRKYFPLIDRTTRQPASLMQ